MKNILSIILLTPTILYSQNSEPIYSFEELFHQIEQNNPPITKNFSEGWNMFGYPCISQNNVEQTFLPIVNNIIVVKNNDGIAYLPEYNFNGLGNFISGEGYQAKVTTPINDFTFCEGVMLPNIEELNIIGSSQEIDSLETSSFYLGILDENQYNINYSEDLNYDNWNIVFDIKILSPEELVNAIYISFLDINVNGSDYGEYWSSAWKANHEMQFSATNLYDGDVIDITFITTEGIFTIREVLNLESINPNIDQIEVCPNLHACPYEIFIEYDSLADAFSEHCCETLIVFGCNDSLASNYNELANMDDGNCEHIYGCNDILASNYNSEATSNDESCIYYGCIDELAGNFDQLANTDDGSCLVGGCLNITAENYNYEAQIDDGSCIIYGCTIDLFPNFNPVANTGNNSCDMISSDIFGCTDGSMVNFNESANIDNGTCSNITAIGDEISGGIVFYVDSTGEKGLIVAKESLTNNGNILWASENSYLPYNLVQDSCMGSGLGNTISIESSVSFASACLSYEVDGFDDWFLPSINELEKIFENLEPISDLFYTYFSSSAQYYSSTIGDYDNGLGLYICSTFEDCCPYFVISSSTYGYNTSDFAQVRPIKAYGNWILGCTDSLACNYTPEANMSDGSCEYAEFGYDCESNIIDIEYVIGMEAHGGIVFFIDETGEHGLVANMWNLPGTYEWGCYEENVDGADANIIGSGYQNTMDIINQGCITQFDGVTAAQATINFDSDGYNDWYLPSLYELTEMYDKIGLNSNITDEVVYWSSSEYDEYFGYAFFLYDGDEGFNDAVEKSVQLHVRPIRSF